jgi:hypothetical protein
LLVVGGIPGMAATALCITVLAVQARRAGLFGQRMAVFTWIVAAVLLLSFLFIPILALMAWIVVAVIAARRQSQPYPVAQPGQHAAALTGER